MDHILKALNDALENKEYQIKWLNEEIEKLRKERDELQEENKSLKDELNFYRSTKIPTAADEEDF